jgi:hypothetical protein
MLRDPQYSQSPSPACQCFYRHRLAPSGSFLSLAQRIGPTLVNLSELIDWGFEGPPATLIALEHFRSSTVHVASGINDIHFRSSTVSSMMSHKLTADNNCTTTTAHITVVVTLHGRKEADPRASPKWAPSACCVVQCTLNISSPPDNLPQGRGAMWIGVESNPLVTALVVCAAIHVMKLIFWYQL